MSKRVLLIVALGIALVHTPIWAQAGTIYESATLGTIGHTGGSALEFGQFLGSRFTLSAVTDVTAIGGHMIEKGGDGTLWGALISMSGLLPSFAPQDIEANALGFAILTPTSTSDEFIVPLIITLNPGDYALVFGDNSLFGTTGTGQMPGPPLTGAVNFPAGVGSYFFGNATASNSWTNPGPPGRFVVQGTVIPEPSTMLLLGSGLAGLGFFRQRKKVA